MHGARRYSGKENVQLGPLQMTAGEELRNRSPHAGSPMAVLYPPTVPAPGWSDDSLLKGFRKGVSRYFKHMNSVASNIRLHQ